MTAPYLPARRAGDWLVLSGQIGLGPVGLADTFEDQLRQALANMDDLLTANGANSAQVTKATVFLTDMDDYAAMNEIYTGYFAEPRPARTCVAVAGLPLGALVEIEAWAYTGDA
ncbi:MAG TPA: RidA family protein [Microthrixaceae bacterium]|jgi:2-iminobutanoate/2-iminopropanoate deaminase|nr:RidA family protein [Microthrixaceae bacterium]